MNPPEPTEGQREGAEALLERERLFTDMMVDAMPGILYLYDERGKFLRWSRSFEQISGYSPGEIGNMHPLDFFAGNEKQLVAEKIAEVFKTGQSSIEAHFVAKDGRLTPFHFTGKRILLDGVTCLIGMGMDITAQKQAEKLLAESEHKYRELVERANSIILCWNSEGLVSFLNEFGQKFFGYSSAEIVGRHVMDTIVPPIESGGRDLRELIAKICADPKAYEQSVNENMLRNGEHVWIAWTNRIVSETPGGLVEMLSVGTDITERRHAQEALRKSEERYHTTLDGIMEGCQLISFDWRYLYLNDAASIHNRRPNSGLMGRTMMEAWPGIETTGIYAMLKRCMEERIALHKEHDFIFPDGASGWFDVRCQPVPEGIFVLSIDISERKQAEVTNQHLNRVYAVLSGINQTIVREKDAQAIINEACRIALQKGGFHLAWIGLLDESSQKLKIKAQAGADAGTLDILRALIIADPPAGCSFTQGALQTGKHKICNNIAQDPQAASWREVAVRRGYRAMGAFPLKEANKVIGVLNLYAGEPDFFDEREFRLLDELAMDISFALEVNKQELSRRQTEQELRASEERFRAVVENIREVFWIIDPAKHQMLYISPAYEAIWGRTCAALYESPGAWLDAIHPEDRQRVVLALETKQAQGDYDEVYRITRPDGSVRWIRDRAFPIRNEVGEVHRIVGTAEDITAQRQLGEELRQSQKMEAVGQLAGGVAHDFNNILAAIMLQADMAGEPPDVPPQTCEFLQDIKAAAERAANLTRQLLTFSRRQVMQTRLLDLNEIVTSLTKMLQRILGEDIKMQLNLHSHPLFTRADAGMLDQVLMNLVVNARDAMPQGGKLFIETTERNFTAAEAQPVPDLAAGRYVCLRVTDTGAGIPPEIIPRIFEPFFTTKDPGKGTGLGLATVFGIVKQHNGALQLESEAGRGATFRIFLPATKPAEATLAAQAEKPRARGGTETILVVEDDNSVRQLTRVVLERSGYTVLEAAHGVEALRIWERHIGPIDLLLTDIVMPEGIGGRELAQRLRLRNPKLRIIFTSGYSAEIAGRELTLQSGQNFIQKPSRPQDLLETVRRCLDG